MTSTSATLSAAAASSIDKPTQSLIRRVLCSHAPPSQPLEDLLSPLTKSPNVDVQLYALLAIVCRDYIDSWYSKITNDQALVREVVRVVAAVVAAVEHRVDNIDLELLLLDELPALFECHIKDYRLALSRTGTSISPHLTTAQIFHNLQPHPALECPASTHLYNKLLSSGLISALLPPDDLYSPCSNALLRDLLSTMILSNTIEKLSEPWMIYEIITKLITLFTKPSTTTEENPPSTPSSSPPLPPPPPPTYAAVRMIPPTLDTLLTLTTRVLSVFKTYFVALLHTLHTPPAPPPRQKPFLSMSVWRLIPEYLGLSRLQPWLIGGLMLLARPFTTRSNRAGAVLDELLASAVKEKLSEEVVVSLLGVIRSTVFPGNAPMGPGRPIPSEREKARIRDAAVEAILGVIPAAVRRVWFGGVEEEEDGEGEKAEARREETLKRRVDELYLDVFSVKEINRHLWYNVLDLVVGRLVPELVESGPSEVRKRRM